MYFTWYTTTRCDLNTQVIKRTHFTWVFPWLLARPVYQECFPRWRSKNASRTCTIVHTVEKSLQITLSTAWYGPHIPSSEVSCMRNYQSHYSHSRMRYVWPSQLRSCKETAVVETNTNSCLDLGWKKDRRHHELGSGCLSKAIGLVKSIHLGHPSDLHDWLSRTQIPDK